MKRYSFNKFLIILGALFICSFSGYSQTTLTLNPSADAWIRICEKPGYEYITTTNYQTIIRNHASEWTLSGYRLGDRAIMNFDLSSIPAGAVITSARLSLYSQTPQPSDDYKHRSSAMGGYKSNACYLERVTESWSESTVTWANQPPTTTDNRITLPASTAPDQDYLNLDVTAMVQDMIDNPSLGHGFMMRLVNEQYYTRMAFCSREHTDPTRHPKLEITYSIVEPTIDDPIGHWLFNGDISDETGNYSGVSISGNVSPTTDRNDKPNSAYEFDGSYDYITMPDLNIYAGNPFTISSWIKPASGQPTGYGTIMGADYNQRLLLHNNNFLLTQQNGNFFSNYHEVNFDEWNHIMYWFNGTEERWYINGVLHGSRAISNARWDKTFYIGVFQSSNRYYHFKGSIDDIRIYDRALSSAEITLLYNTESKVTTKIPYSEAIGLNPIHYISGSADKTFVQSISPREPLDSLIPVSNFQASESIQYFDGLGRPIQTIAVNASPAGADIIQPIEHDKFGREVYNYLPYAANGNQGQYDPLAIYGGTYKDDYYQGNQYAFYDPAANTNVDYATDIAPFAETVYENSPLNRIYEQGAAGEDWQIVKDAWGYSTEDGHTVKSYYHTNNAGEVNLYESDNTLEGITQNGAYDAGELFITEIRSENFDNTDPGFMGHITREYKDKKGQVVLKESENSDGTWLRTYYVYNNSGNLRCVIPPKALGNASNTELCYYYKYDERNRLAVKKLPGADSILMVYDLRDRLVASQGGNMRDKVNPEWLVTKYDALNRPIMTAVINTTQVSEASSRVALQAHVNTFDGTAGNMLYEIYDAGGVHNYSNNSFPSITNPDDALTVTYYDDYIGFPSGYTGTDYDISHISGFENISSTDFEPTASTNARGLITGNKVKNLSTNDWYFTVSYYDDKGRILQTKSQNQLAGNAYDRVSMDLSFVGEVLTSVVEHNDGDASILVGDRFVYDHSGRLLENYQELLGGEEILLTANTYNELGELISKYNHGTRDGSDYSTIQKTDYRNNIRGWLTSINNTADLLPGSEKDLFAMNLFYNNVGDTDPLVGNDLQYNGNIAAITWKDAKNNIEKAYGFTYDGINRILSADYGDESLGWGTQSYDVGGLTTGSVIEYDLNGNIMKLGRFDDAGALLDKLTYNYLNSENSNQLLKVGDASGNILGFNDDNITNDFTYDKNGNMLTDLNKGIATDIEYNYLNLPDSINHNNGISKFAYNANGQKLAHIVDNGTNIDTTIYVGNFVYENGSLEYIITVGTIMGLECMIRLLDVGTC
jgi:hypothetical protein